MTRAKKILRKYPAGKFNAKRFPANFPRKTTKQTKKLKRSKSCPDILSLHINPCQQKLTIPTSENDIIKVDKTDCSEVVNQASERSVPDLLINLNLRNDSLEEQLNQLNLIDSNVKSSAIKANEQQYKL